jgi:long-chain acyl-CoA synthetase
MSLTVRAISAPRRNGVDVTVLRAYGSMNFAPLCLLSVSGGNVGAVYDGNLTLDILDLVQSQPDCVSLRRRVDGEWTDVSISTFHAEVMAAAKGLISLGVEAGDRVALMSKTRYEWTLLDYAIWWAGAVTVPIYETSSDSQVAWILSNSGSRVIFVESDKHEAEVEAAKALAETPIEISHLGRMSDALDSLVAAGAAVSDDELEARRAALGPDSIATLIYTSGTTGRPKGCILTHGNFRAELGGAFEMLPEIFDDESGSTLLFLPLAHVFARIIEVGTIRAGRTLGHSAEMADLIGDLSEFHPTYVLAVPRVFEKIFNAASANAYAEGQNSVFDRAARTAISYSRALDSGKVGLSLKTTHAIFDKLVYAKMRDALGGRTQYAISGGAPLGDRLGHFFRGIGVTILEGYGLTETTAALCVNQPNNQRIGSVGRTFPGVEVRVAPDGELQFRGPQIFRGYWENDEDTQAVLDADGWLATGDLGEIDEDGFIRITGRKKEILVTAGGKNVAPTVLEDRIRAHPYISQCLVVGEGKPFIAALVTIDTEMWDGSLHDPDLVAKVQEAIDDANTQVSRAESIRKFVILPGDWTEENGYLTPSFKVKRHVVMRDYHDTVESLYVT